MALSPEEIMAALHGIGADTRNVTPFPTQRAMPGAANSPPPISKDPWFDMLGDGAQGNVFQQPAALSSEPLYLWATNTDGRRVRADGPFANPMDAQRALLQAKQSGIQMQLDIGPS